LPNVQAPSFLSGKAKQFGLPNPKAGFADIHRNIEQGLLLDPLRSEHKIASNFPRTPFAKMVLLAVQIYEQNAATVQQMLDETLQKATAVDGVTGEKGLANYSALAVRAIAHIVGLFDRVYPNLLARAVWIDYDSGGGHGHHDALNVGMFAFGLDLMVDFGYPPVQYGGWESEKVRWYYSTAAHNTVVVDGRNQRGEAGRHTLWATVKGVQAIRVSAPAVYGIPQFERTLVMVDVSDKDFYVLDIFRVVGGSTHDRFMHSTFGSGGSPPRRREAPAGGDGRGGPLAPSAQFPQAPPREGARVGRFAFGTAAGAADERGRTDEEHAADGAAWMRC